MRRATQSQPHRCVALMVLLMGLIVTSCAGSRADNESAVPNDAEVSVRVQNDAFWDANVYLLHGSTRRRLGTVGTHSTSTFKLPRHLTIGVSELRFVVDFIGRRDGAVSETILATPGDQIELTIR